MPNHFNEFNPRKKPTLRKLFNFKSWFQNDQMDRICTIFLTFLVVFIIFLLFFLRNMNLFSNISSEPINLQTYE